jgi:hypothetical protein
VRRVVCGAGGAGEIVIRTEIMGMNNAGPVRLLFLAAFGRILVVLYTIAPGTIVVSHFFFASEAERARQQY